jgi:hypothetical protein
VEVYRNRRRYDKDAALGILVESRENFSEKMQVALDIGSPALE